MAAVALIAVDEVLREGDAVFFEAEEFKGLFHCYQLP